MIRSYNNADANDKYKFTEKERDKETNLDYFGARYYDASIGRWLAVDPLAEKYPGWSPYNYCINNPLIVYDPDGREIWIAYYEYDDTGYGTLKEKYQYKEGKLYDKKGNEYKGKNQFILEVKEILNNLVAFNDKIINEIINELETNSFTNYIANQEKKLGSCAAPWVYDKADKGEGTSGIISFNDSVIDGKEQASFASVLGHELFHTYDYNKGNMKGYYEDSKKPGYKKPSEVRAIIFENIIRNYQGIEKRTTYGGKKIDFNNNKIRK